jgi:hypothetical protein
MIDIAKHIRIFKIEPDDDFVNKRTEAINTIEEGLKKKTGVQDILLFSNALTKGLRNVEMVDPLISDIVGQAIKKHSPAFVAEGQNLEILSCALLSVLQYLNNSNESRRRLITADVLALSLLCAISYQEPITDKPKLESLRQEVLEVSLKVITDRAASTRRRASIGEIKPIAAAPPTTIPELTKMIEKALNNMIDSVKFNAAVDREEINLLWFIMNDWSDIAAKRISELNEIQKIIVRGLEISALLTRMPFPSHINLVLIDADRTRNVTPLELFNELGDLKELIKAYLKNMNASKINSFPNLFPLYHTLLNPDHPDMLPETKRPMSEWARGMLLEGVLLDIQKILNDGE